MHNPGARLCPAQFYKPCSAADDLDLLGVNGAFGIDKELPNIERVQACAKAALAAIPGSYVASDTGRCVLINIPSIGSSIMFYTYVGKDYT